MNYSMSNERIQFKIKRSEENDRNNNNYTGDFDISIERNNFLHEALILIVGFQNRTNSKNHRINRKGVVNMPKKFDMSRYRDEPDFVTTTKYGGKVEFYTPIDRENDDFYIEQLQKNNKLFQKRIYDDIYHGRRTWQEILAQIREYYPDYNPPMVPWEEIYGK